jgi:hypothetical protein
MKQRELCPGCGGKPARWYVRVGRAVLVFTSVVLGGFFDPRYPGQEGWIHTTDDCPVWASARAEFLRKKKRR